MMLSGIIAFLSLLSVVLLDLRLIALAVANVYHFAIIYSLHEKFQIEELERIGCQSHRKKSKAASKA